MISTLCKQFNTTHRHTSHKTQNKQDYKHAGSLVYFQPNCINNPVTSNTHTHTPQITSGQLMLLNLKFTVYIVHTPSRKWSQSNSQHRHIKKIKVLIEMPIEPKIFTLTASVEEI